MELKASHLQEILSCKMYCEGGSKFCIVNLRTGNIRTLIADPEGALRDPQVHYNGKKIVFSWRKGGTEFYHLYEMNLDGTGLRQLTGGNFDDIEPTYLPNDDIIFGSTRCNRWVACGQYRTTRGPTPPAARLRPARDRRVRPHPMHRARSPELARELGKRTMSSR